VKPLGASGRNLQRRFELHGYFWVPTREREMIEGTLSYDPGRPPTLRLARLFSDEAPDDAFFEGPQPRDLVYGMDHGGELMTLYRLGAGQVLGGSLARYECEIAALGDHFTEDEQLDTLRVRIAGLGPVSKVGWLCEMLPAWDEGT
jgi:hypothetical protein